MTNTKIMVVDDNLQVLEVIGISLRSLGYSVETFESAETALFQSSLWLSDIDVLLTDFEMPGMNGMELALHMTAIQPELRVVIMSGKTHMIPPEAAQIASIIQKPFSLKAITTVISQRPCFADASLNQMSKRSL